MKQKKQKDTSGAKGGKVAVFFKKNIYIVLMVACVIAIAAMITVAAVMNSKPKDPASDPTINTPDPGNDKDPGKDPGKEPDKDPDKNDPTDNPTPNPPPEFVFLMESPVSGGTKLTDFDNLNLVFNNTQEHWATHEGIDFAAPAGSAVTCVFDGVIESVTTDNYYGTVVTVKHEGDFTSVYKLMQNPTVKAGDTVKQGAKLGEVSAEALAEIADGAHLHFELMKNGKLVNPNPYFAEGNK